MCLPARAAPCRPENNRNKAESRPIKICPQGVKGTGGIFSAKNVRHAGGPAGPGLWVAAGVFTWRTALFQGWGRLDPPDGGRLLVLFRPSLRCGDGVLPQRALCRCPRNTAKEQGLSTTFIPRRGRRLGPGVLGALGFVLYIQGVGRDCGEGGGRDKSCEPSPVSFRRSPGLPLAGPRGIFSAHCALSGLGAARSARCGLNPLAFIPAHPPLGLVLLPREEHPPAHD